MIVAEVLENEVFEVLFKESIHVGLAQDGIHYIGEQPYARALAALAHFSEKLHYFDVTLSYVRAIGTAAFREASNGVALMKDIFDLHGIKITLVTGHEEAHYIYEGVVQAIPPQVGRFLIMDIGGGSVEFIIAEKNNIIWAESFPIGIGILFNTFPHANPILPSERQAIRNYLLTQLQPLQQQAHHFSGITLVGASGTFDVLETFLMKDKPTPHCTSLESNGFDDLYLKITNTTLEERYAIPLLRRDRVRMIVVALELIKTVIDIVTPANMIVSSYSLREGVLKEMIKNN